MKNRTMINNILSLVLTASMLACATQKNGNTAASDNESAMDVTLTITMTSNYCGGVPPTDEMIENLKKAKPFSSKKFYISSEEALQDDMVELTSSASGTIDASLKKGTYFVFLPEKVTAKLSSKDRSESACTEWRNTPNGTFTVESTQGISFNIHKTCDGCGALRM